MAADIGKRVAVHRNKAGMTVQALADRCAELGLSLDRTVITKLEKGRRQSITVPEVLVLARALRVSPLVLIFPISRADVTEVLPGRDMPPFQAALWFSGERPWPDGSEAEADAWWSGSFAVIAERQHAELLQAHREDLRRAGSYRRTASDGAANPAELQGAASMYEREAADIERRLRGVRKAMRDRGFIPPELPAHLAHVDCPNGDSAVPVFDRDRPGSPGYPGDWPS